MTTTKSIYDLHSFDERIRALNAELAETVRILQDETELERARKQARGREEDLAEFQRQQREADSLISDIQSRLVPAQRKAYSGSVKNPRELEAFEHEIKLLKKRLSDAEDRSLVLMDSVDAAEREAEKAGTGLSSVEDARREEVERLTGDKGRFEGELSELGLTRQGLATSIDGADMRLYESLRSSKSGGAVAKVERGMCQGCRISLPMSAIQRARVGQIVVQCPSCERILFVR